MNSASAYRIPSPLFLTHRVRRVRVLRDTPQEQKVNFHIESGDYFGTLATIIGLSADLLEHATGDTKAHCIAMLHQLRDDLSYAQKTYKIVRKD